MVKNRLLAGFLTLAMLLSMCPLSAFAEEEGKDAANPEIVYETHPGIGSIEDILPLSSTYNIVPGQTYDNCYYNQLEDVSKNVYSAIYSSKLKDGPSTDQVPLSGVTYSDDKNKAEPVSAAVAALVYDHPELSWLINTEWGYYSNADQKTLTAFCMTEKGYTDATTPYTEGEYGHADTKDRAAIEAAINKAVTAIGPLTNTSDYEKIRAIHDWVCNNMKYTDQDSDKFKHDWRGFQTAYSALVEGDTVCAGYSKSFKLLCDEYGIPCAIVSGLGNGGAHAWNYVQCDGNWYGVDCTWDDLDPGVRYDYFLKGYTTFTENGTDHEEGTLYKVYQFDFPDLNAEDYKAPNAPDSIDLTYTPKEDGVSSKGVRYFMVPTVSEWDGKAVKEVTFTAVPKKDGSTVSDQKVDWILSVGADGVTLVSNDDGTATLTIDNSTCTDYDPSQGYIGGYTVTVTAMCGTTSASQELGVWVNHKAANFIKILKDNTEVASDTLAPNNTANYTAQVYD